jgi:hypothetical protein
VASKKTPATKSHRKGGKAIRDAKRAVTMSEGGREQAEERTTRKTQRKRSRSVAEQRGLVGRDQVIFAVPDPGCEAVGWPGLVAVEATAYGTFLQTAFEQYQAEFAHMLKLGQTFASQNSILLKQQIEIAAPREAACTGSGQTTTPRAKNEQG